MRMPTRLIAVGAALALAGCGRAPAAAAATVNGAPIWTDTLELLVSAQVAEAGAALLQPDPEQYPKVELTQQQILTQLVQDMLVAQRAGEFRINVTGADIQQRFEEFGQQFGGADRLREEIARRGRTESDVRQQIGAILRGEALRMHFAEQVQLSDAAVRAAYRERLPTQYRVADVSHILVENEQDAKQIIEQLAAGADFAKLAREHSTDSFSAANGGKLGPNPRGTFVAEFEDAVWSAREGQVVGPVKTQFGYHVIRVDDVREIPFAEVAAQLREELAGREAQERYDAWFQRVLGDARIWVHPRFGRWDAERGQVVPSGALPPAEPPPVELTPGTTATPGAS